MTKKEEVIRILINKMLEPYKVDYDYIKENPVIDGKNWYTYYTMSEEQEKEFEAFAVDVLKKELRLNQVRAESEYSWFSLMYGLKVVKNDKD